MNIKILGPSGANRLNRRMDSRSRREEFAWTVVKPRQDHQERE